MNLINTNNPSTTWGIPNNNNTKIINLLGSRSHIIIHFKKYVYNYFSQSLSHNKKYFCCLKKVGEGEIDVTEKCFLSLTLEQNILNKCCKHFVSIRYSFDLCICDLKFSTEAYSYNTCKALCFGPVYSWNVSNKSTSHSIIFIFYFYIFFYKKNQIRFFFKVRCNISKICSGL